MKFFLLILSFLTLTQARAGLLRPGAEFARATGMGNAFLALADDANTLFYNPAGLARVKGVHFHLIDTQLTVDNSDTLTRVRKAVFDGEYENLIRTDTQTLGFAIKPTFVIPYFGISFFNQSYGFFDMQSFTSPIIDVYAYNDVGVNVGIGIPFGDLFSFGIGVKAIQRTGIDTETTPQDFITSVGTDVSTLQENVFDHLKEGMGAGYAFPLSLGVLMTIPEFAKGSPRIRLAATVENLGNTPFKAFGDEPPPRNLEMSYNFGALLQYDLSKGSVFNLTADFRHQLKSFPFAKTFHFGAEYRHPVFGLRAGIHQGYPTFGASLEFPPHTRLHFSTYSVELGEKLWERERRVYQLQLVIGFSPL